MYDLTSLHPQKKFLSSCMKNSSLEKFVGLLVSTFLLHNDRLWIDVHWLPWEVFVKELKYVSSTIAQLNNFGNIVLVNEACAVKYMKIVGIAKLNVRSSSRASCLILNRKTPKLQKMWT